LFLYWFFPFALSRKDRSNASEGPTSRDLHLTSILFLAFLTRAHAGAPLELVRTSVDKAIQILKDPKLSSNDKKRERMDRLREALDGIFDYEEMAKRALGTHWRQRTPAEQQEFVKLFRNFLESVYSDKMNLYGGQKVRFGREVIDNDYAQVETTIIQPKGDEIAGIT
jgi:phospholipid transport system substrate-binding protein